jgi:hypothetical protein
LEVLEEKTVVFFNFLIGIANFDENSKIMETLFVTVSNENAATALSSFLGTIDYVEQISRTKTTTVPPSLMTLGDYKDGEKPSDFAGIWRNRKKIDAKQLRKRAWRRKK